MSNILISVITVVYNDKFKLESTLLSFINQKYNHTELILIDGGSTDGTLETIKKYENKISYWVSEPDKGIYDAMNKGLRQAKGHYVYFLNSGDNLVDNNVLQKISEEIEKDPVEVICGKVYVTSGHNHDNILGTFPKYRVNGPGYRKLFNSSFCHQALFISRDAYLNIGGFDQRFKTFADFYAVSQIVKKNNPIKYIEIPIAFFDNDGVSSSWSHVKNLEFEKKEIFKLLGEKQNVFYDFIRNIKTNLFIARKKIAHARFNR